jgi:hypothetical protein
MHASQQSVLLSLPKNRETKPQRAPTPSFHIDCEVQGFSVTTVQCPQEGERGKEFRVQVFLP